MNANLGFGIQGQLSYTKIVGETKTLNWLMALLYAVLAVASFHLAFTLDWSLCIIGFLFCLVGLTNLSSNRKAFYFGFVIGFCIYAPHLAFFGEFLNGRRLCCG